MDAILLHSSGKKAWERSIGLAIWQWAQSVEVFVPRVDTLQREEVVNNRKYKMTQPMTSSTTSELA